MSSPSSPPRPLLRLLPLVVSAVMALGFSCGGSPKLPALLSTAPTDGATNVPRTVWLELHFAAPVNRPDLVTLSCGGAPVSVTASTFAAGRVLVNPLVDLPSQTDCTATWPGPAGAESLDFRTAAHGGAAELLYGRDDGRTLAPLPDDVFAIADGSTETGLRLAIPPRTLPGVLEQGLTSALVANANTADGWSPVGHATLEVSEALDLASIPLTPAESLDPLAAIGWYDLTPGSAELGARIPFRTEFRSEFDPSSGATHHSLLLLPSIRLSPGGVYGLVVTRRAQVHPGRPLDPSPAFAAVLADPTPGETAETALARSLAHEVLVEIGQHADVPLQPQDVAVALRMTIRGDDHLADDMLAMHQAIQDLPTPSLQITSIIPSAHPGVALEVRGTWTAPEFRMNTNLLARDADGLPVYQGDIDVPFVLALPDAAVTTPAPLILYQHGNPGDAEEMFGSYVRTGTSGQSLASEGFAFIGFTDPANRDIGSELAVQTQASLATLIVFGTPVEWDAQSWAEQIAFVEALSTLGGLDLLPFSSFGDGQPDLDVSSLLYLGISEGAVKGSGNLAYLPDIRAAALVVGGARHGERLVHQAEFTGLLDDLNALAPEFTPPEVWTGMGLLQLAQDAQEPHNHAPYLYADPHPLGPPARASLLITEGLTDPLVSNHSTRALAHTLTGVLHVLPQAESTPVLATASAPLAANVNATTTAGFYQFVPTGVPGIPATPGCAFQSNGHFCAQSAAESVDQRIEFFRTAVEQNAPVIIDPLAP